MILVEYSVQPLVRIKQKELLKSIQYYLVVFNCININGMTLTIPYLCEQDSGDPVSNYVPKEEMVENG